MNRMVRKKEKEMTLLVNWDLLLLLVTENCFDLRGVLLCGCLDALLFICLYVFLSKTTPPDIRRTKHALSSCILTI